MQSVTGKKLEPIPAILTGYQRFKIKGKTYPGIINSTACSIEGMLYEDIGEQTLGLLDQFEDILYERCLLDVQVGSNFVKALVYVIRDEYRECLSDEEWNLEEFKRKYLKLYLKGISDF